tara:strand:+ start:8417 stop:8854 length:438 start_codon:yes stop_codon:yes gene_type:complete
MKEFKTKSELYAEYVRLMEKYEPEPVIKKKEEKINAPWSMEAYEIEKKRSSFGLCGYEKWRGIIIREHKLQNEETKPDVNCCAKCKKHFPYPTSYLLCGDCYAKFGYYNIEGNGENYKKFLGKDAEHNNNGFNRVLPRGKCLIKI